LAPIPPGEREKLVPMSEQALGWDHRNNRLRLEAELTSNVEAFYQGEEIEETPLKKTNFFVWLSASTRECIKEVSENTREFFHRYSGDWLARIEKWMDDSIVEMQNAEWEKFMRENEGQQEEEGDINWTPKPPVENDWEEVFTGLGIMGGIGIVRGDYMDWD
jgi:hypothetical protein